jgi:hypothetical protein
MLLLAAVSFTMLPAQELLPVQRVQDSQTKRSNENFNKRLWQASIATLSVANVLDVQSSLGKRELNATLAGSSGTLGARGILLKSSFQGGLLSVEYLMLHRHGFMPSESRSKLYRTLSIINFAASGVLSGIAAHNYTVPRTQP